MDGQEKRCFVTWLLILHSGHRGEGCSVGLILCRYVMYWRLSSTELR